MTMHQDEIGIGADTGGFSAADPALDLIAAWHLFDTEARSVFRDAVGTGVTEWLRGAAWAFQQAMGRHLPP